MPDNQFSLADYHQNDGGGPGVFGRAVTEIPSATAELLSEAWANPGATIGHAAKTVVEAGVMGTAIGYLVPARGPASIIVGVALTAPAIYKAGARLAAAEEQSRDPLADQQAIAHMLARDTVSGTTDLGLSFAGGFAGTEIGYALARSNGVFGRVGQTTQRGIMAVENKGLTWAKSISEGKIPGVKSSELPKVDMQGGIPKGPGSSATSLVNMRPTPDGLASNLVKPSSVAPERLPFGQRTLGILNRRAEQIMATPQTALGAAKTNGAQGDYQMYMGSLHGHSRYSDGMGLPKDLYAKAKSEGYDFMAVTDHNHTAARGGVKPGDPRAGDQSGTPTVAESPILYAQTFADAAAATKNGEFVGIVGVELGTIGKVAGGHHHDDFLGPITPEAPVVKPGTPEVKTGDLAAGTPAPKADGSKTGQIDISVKIPGKGGEAGPEGILPEVKEPVGTVGKTELKPETPPATDNTAGTGEKSATRTLQEIQAEAVAAKHLGGVNHIILLEMPQFVETIREGHSLVAPEVVKVPDGNFKQLADFLDTHMDSTGGTAVIQLAHPRYRADENPNVPAADRGRDYGQKSFKSKQEWLDRFADPYVRQVELIKGGALTPDPVDVVAPGHLDPTSFAGYLDKGVHASPTFGRDYHYGNPGGNPGATGIMSKSLDKPALMNALRERRTIATTNGEKLTGSMWGNDTHPMGSILDQAAIKDLSLSAKIGGEVVPEAEYTVKLWGDTKLGDKKLAEVVEEKTVTGAELLANGNSVSFDPVTHKLGNKSAYYMEIQRKDPGTGHVDKMWTAPIWVEPLTGDKHSFYMRWLTGNSAQFLEGLARGKIKYFHVKNQKFIQPFVCILALLLIAFGWNFNSSQVMAGNGPTKDQEYFIEYKQKHRNNTAFIEKYTRAMHCLEYGQYKTAVRLFKELTKEDPKWPGVWVSLGTANLWLEDYQSGIECNTKAMALRPKDADIYRRRALHYVALFKYKEALADLDQAYKLEPTDFDILKLRASCYKALKRYPEAVADYDRMLKKYPNYEEVLHDKSRAYLDAKDWKHALLTLDVLLKFYPNDETSLLDRASTKMRVLDYKGAIQDYTKVISIGAEAPDYVFSKRAIAYEKLGMKKEAARDRARVHAY